MARGGRRRSNGASWEGRARSGAPPASPEVRRRKAMEPARVPLPPARLKYEEKVKAARRLDDIQEHGHSMPPLRRVQPPPENAGEIPKLRADFARQLNRHRRKREEKVKKQYGDTKSLPPNAMRRHLCPYCGKRHAGHTIRAPAVEDSLLVVEENRLYTRDRQRGCHHKGPPPLRMHDSEARCAIRRYRRDPDAKFSCHEKLGMELYQHQEQRLIRNKQKLLRGAEGRRMQLAKKKHVALVEGARCQGCSCARRIQEEVRLENKWWARDSFLS